VEHCTVKAVTGSQKIFSPLGETFGRLHLTNSAPTFSTSDKCFSAFPPRPHRLQVLNLLLLFVCFYFYLFTLFAFIETKASLEKLG